MARTRIIQSFERRVSREYGYPKGFVLLSLPQLCDAYDACAQECLEKAEQHFTETKAAIESKKDASNSSVLASDFIRLAGIFSRSALEVRNFTETGQIVYSSAVRMAVLERTGNPQHYTVSPNFHSNFSYAEIFKHLPSETRAHIVGKRSDNRLAA